MPPKRKNSSSSTDATTTTSTSKSVKTTKSSTPASTTMPTTTSNSTKNPSTSTLKSSFLKILSNSGSTGSTQDEIQSQNSYLTPSLITQFVNSLTGNTIELFIRKKDGKSEPCFVLKKQSQSGGLSKEEEFVYQMISKSGNLGIWTKDIKLSSGLPSQTLTKIYKTLTSKGLIKPFKSVASKTKTLYMLEGIEPAKELTGGPWYTEQEFDFEFISELRSFVLMLIRSTPKIDLQTITKIVEESKISKIKLAESDVKQLVRTLELDKKIVGEDVEGYEIVKNGFLEMEERTGRESGMFSFMFWECLERDWHWRVVRFGEGGGIGAHEPHHQSN
ncbi:hypothetical protein TrLO_g5553 [Triparma laevis f. longispina]|uniref:RNA polymerase III subunit C6 n=1 Tax=Triparma laevis f. longispina TaxID=1714387 RepID=A0A9W7F5X1_9STRA|nr:hypothetical protein TrLO_g5553 [Triparma laevis f. longispina]